MLNLGMCMYIDNNDNWDIYTNALAFQWIVTAREGLKLKLVHKKIQFSIYLFMSIYVMYIIHTILYEICKILLKL
jgi:hypothetical protein